MSVSVPDAASLATLGDAELWAELGRSIRMGGLGLLPEEEAEEPTDEEAGRWFFARQLENIKKLYCSEAVTALVRDEKKRDVTVFVASLIDIFAAYFGLVAGTIILVQIHKIGVDRFCSESADSSP